MRKEKMIHNAEKEYVTFEWFDHQTVNEINNLQASEDDSCSKT